MRRASHARAQATAKQVREHLDAASDLAVEIVERMARSILREHPALDEFCMAMGCATFSVKASGELLDTADRAYMRGLDKFIDEFNPQLGLTGCPMRFTADGPTVTEW